MSDLGLFATPTKAAESATALKALFPFSTEDVSEFARRYVQATRASVYRDPYMASALSEVWKRHNGNEEAFYHELMLDGVRVWSLCKWHDGGMPIFRPTESLAAALSLSKYGKLLVGDVPWPFDTFAIEMPRPWLPKPFDTLGLIWVYKTKVHLKDREGEVDVVRVEATGADAVAYDKLAPLDGDVEKWIEWKGTREFSEPMNDDEFALGRLAVRLAVGLSIYLATLPAPEAGAGRVAKKRKKTPGTTGKAWIWDLGREIKLPRELRLAAVDFANATRRVAKSGWRLTRRFAVRGHFRRVVVGPRALGERRWTWVKPFWKGPEGGIALRRTYIVDEEQVRCP